MARRFQVSPRSPFALLEHMGHDVAGALQFVRPGDESEDARADRSALTPGDDDAIADELRETIRAYRTGRSPAHVWGRISLAGAQPKIALVRSPDGSWLAPGQGVPTTHILKPQLTLADERYPDLTVVEAFGLSLARHVGLRAPTWTMWSSPDGRVRALVVERYDRRLDENGAVRRLHQEDLCQALAVSPARKYQHQEGGPGVGQIGRLIRLGLGARDRGKVAADLLAAITLNVAFVNTDAHAKNYSLMLSGSNVALSPVYDVSSFALYTDTDEPPLHFPMSIGGEFQIRGILPGAVIDEGVRLGLARDDAAEVVRGVLERLPEAFELARDELVPLPDGARVVDVVRAQLPAVSPLYRSHAGVPAVIDLSAAGARRGRR